MDATDGQDEPQLIAPGEVRYIKLGDGGRWAADAISNGYVAFGYHSIPHEVCVAGGRDEIRRLLDHRGSEGAKTAGVNEVMTFYEMGTDCLWVTFAGGHLWWTFADTEVIWLGDEDGDGPSRIRPSIGGWRNTDLAGRPLKVSGLSSRLTKTANFRATICTVEEQDYLLRRINAVEEPVVARARGAKSAMMAVAVDMVRGLHWADFETLAELIFARSGWQRSTPVGERLADIDILMEQPTTGETAFVQVKSRAGQAELDDYLSRFRASGYDRFFFVCHSARGPLVLPEEPRLHLFSGQALADAAVKNGLFDWLVERSR
jgi:hypothetical protein